MSSWRHQPHYCSPHILMNKGFCFVVLYHFLRRKVRTWPGTSLFGKWRYSSTRKMLLIITSDFFREKTSFRLVSWPSNFSSFYSERLLLLSVFSAILSHTFFGSSGLLYHFQLNLWLHPVLKAWKRIFRKWTRDFVDGYCLMLDEN